jgi:hypothetical protein
VRWAGFSLSRWERVGVRAFQSIHDRLQNRVEILKDVGIPEAENSQAAGFQTSSAAQVSTDLFVLGVTSAVDLHDKVGIRAEEIDHVGTYWRLAAKFRAGETTAPKPEREPLLHFGRTKAELTSLREFIAIQRRLSRHALSSQ